MRVAAALLLLACGCGSGPYGPFDAGYDIHVILLPKPAPKKGVTVEPVVTVGAEVVQSPPRLLKAGESPAVEVAILRVPAGRQSLSVREPRLGKAARMDLDVTRETWVVMEIRPKESAARLRAYDHPPNDEIGRYVPLVPVPD